MSKRTRTALSGSRMWLCRLLVACLFVLFPGGSQADTFDLAGDWSDATNPFGPNGVWSLTKRPNLPDDDSLFLINQEDWDPDRNHFQGPQRAWADAQQPFSGAVPLWAKITSEPQVGADCIVPFDCLDLVVNKVAMHGFGTGGITGVNWTSPFNGVATIVGDVWLGRDIGRVMDWVILKNGVPITDGRLFDGDEFHSDNPFNFKAGSGGESVLTQSVSVDDVITLQLVNGSCDVIRCLAFDEFVGVELRIEIPVVPAPHTLFLLGSGLAGLGAVAWRGRRRW